MGIAAGRDRRPDTQIGIRRYLPPQHVALQGCWSHSRILSRASQEASAVVVLGKLATLRDRVPARHGNAGWEGSFNECVATSLQERWRIGESQIKVIRSSPGKACLPGDAPLSLSRNMP